VPSVNDAFRDDLEAARLRVDQLVDENAELRAKVDALEAKIGASEEQRAALGVTPAQNLKRNWILGALLFGGAAGITALVTRSPAGERAAPAPLPAADPDPVLDEPPAKPSPRIHATAKGNVGAPLLGMAHLKPVSDFPWLFGPQGHAVGKPVVAREARQRVQSTGVQADLLGGTVLDREENHVVAVGRGGTIVTTDDGGRHWSSAASGVVADLTAAADDEALGVFAVGTGGTIVHRVAGAWLTEASNTTSDLYAVAVAGNTVLAVGAGGTVVRRASDTWSVVAVPVSQTLRAIFVNGEHDVFVAGDHGSMLVEVDGQWNPLPPPTTEDIRGIMGFVQHLIVVTDRGNAWVVDPEQPPVRIPVANDALVGIAFAGSALLTATASGELFKLGF
jgi:hypothetical protein